MIERPKCPNCKKELAQVCYCEPDEFFEKFVKRKTVFLRGLELKNVDRSSPERIVYHCYNCEISYSKNLKIFISEKEVLYPYEEINNIINNIADKIIAELNLSQIEYLKQKPEYDHFGFGLYIRNAFVYNNADIKYRVEADSFSKKIYNKVLEKLD